MTEKQLVIVGLGNPGKEYEMTRHNMGYLVVQALAHSLGLVFKEEKRFYSAVAKGRFTDVAVHLLLPTTYMNESGRAVRHYLDFYRLGPEQLIVISDDVALPYGTTRLRGMGSPGGHNGLKSIQAHLNTQEYTRLKLGIGIDRENKTLAEYVLDTFSQEERQQLPSFIASAVTVLKRLMQDGLPSKQ